MKITNPIIILAAILCFGCKKDFVVKDIDQDSLVVNAPVNNLVTSNNTITFWWEELDGAEAYNIQIVKPTFSAVTELLVDTSIATNKFLFSLLPGTYQWRIRATNAGHKTAFQTFNLTIDSTDVLTNQLVIPLSPLNGAKLGSKVINFSWNALNAATSYSLEFKMNGSVVHNAVNTGTSYQYTFPMTSASNYTVAWRIKAINASSISQYNTAQTITVDLAPPAVSSPSLPLNNALVRDTTSLKWNKLGGTDTKLDSIFIYTDVGLLNLARRATSTANSIKINELSSSNPLPAGSSSTTPIQYWWRVKSIDSLGNTSGFSNSLSFLLY